MTYQYPGLDAEQIKFLEYIGEIVRKTEIERVRFVWGDHVAERLERAQGMDVKL